MVKLLDGVSGPAKSAASSSSKLEAELRKQQRVLEQLDAKQRAATDPIRALESALRKQNAAAESAARGVASLTEKMGASASSIERERSVLASMRDEFAALNEASSVSIAEARSLQAAIASQEATVASAVAKHGALAEQLSKVAAKGAEAKAKSSELSTEIGTRQAKAADDAKKNITELEAAIKKEKDAADKAKEGNKGFGDALKALGPYAAAAAAALAVVVGVVVGGVTMAAQASAFKTQATAALQATLGSAQAAKETFAEVRAISDDLPISEAKAQQLAASLLQSGLQRDQLGDALKAVASMQAVQGEEAGNKITEAIKKSAAGGAFKLEGEALVGTGLDMTSVIDKLSSDLGETPAIIKKKLAEGKIAAADGIGAITSLANGKFGELGKSAGFADLGNIVDKVKSTFMRFFEDVDFGPLVGEIKGFLDLFSSSRPAGDAMKSALGGAVQGLLDGAKAAFPYIKSAILEVIIFALKMYIAFKPLIAAVKAFFGGSGGDVLIGVFKAIWFVVSNLVIALGYLYSYIYTNVVQAFTTLADLGMVAAQFIAGLVQGITQGAGMVWDAIKQLATGMISTIKSVLGIASPSRVGKEMGGFTAEGVGEGVEEGTPDVQASMEQLVAPPPLATTTSANTNAGAGGGTFTWNGDINFGGGKVPSNAAEMKQAAQEAFSEMLEQFVIQMGGAAA